MNNCIVEVNGRWLMYLTPTFAPVVTSEKHRAAQLPRKQADMVAKHLQGDYAVTVHELVETRIKIQTELLVWLFFKTVKSWGGREWTS